MLKTPSSAYATDFLSHSRPCLVSSGGKFWLKSHLLERSFYSQTLPLRKIKHLITTAFLMPCVWKALSSYLCSSFTSSGWRILSSFLPGTAYRGIVTVISCHKTVFTFPSTNGLRMSAALLWCVWSTSWVGLCYVETETFPELVSVSGLWSLSCTGQWAMWPSQPPHSWGGGDIQNT